MVVSWYIWAYNFVCMYMRVLQIMSAHSRWEAFRGESSDMRDRIFTAKRSSMIQLKTKLDVFLANNRDEHVCDFRVKGSWLERSCVIYAGESSTSIVAQVLQNNETPVGFEP